MVKKEEGMVHARPLISHENTDETSPDFVAEGQVSKTVPGAEHTAKGAIFADRQLRLEAANLRLEAGRTTNLLTGDRHRRSGHPLTPSTPPCIRVRTRRFTNLGLAG